jgi:exopolysaccharide biosynthesis WecB/TagA/CpsF family protein/anti-anti-sigma factor
MEQINRSTLVLGIPIDDLTLEEAVDRTLELADGYRKDGRPRNIATVNVDFLTNALGWFPSRPPRHPELLEVLRRADLVTADGMPLVWLANMLGAPVRARVTGADLVPALAKAMAVSGHTLYLLGGKGDIAEQAARELQANNPGLRIVGVHAPFVHTEGDAVTDSEAEDEEVLQRLNAADPDVLLIGFGNPKQELWFHRNRHRIRAGVTIGVGGTFEFIVGRVSRAPEWMQKTGVEWIYRITQDPKRLWKRYAIGLAKLVVMSIPMVIYYRLSQSRAKKLTAPSQQFSSEGYTDGTLVLPAHVDAAWLSKHPVQIFDESSRGSKAAVDFSALEFIDSSDLGVLVRYWKSAQNNGVDMVAYGLDRSKVKSLLKMTRVWDLFAQNQADVADRVLSDVAVEESRIIADGFIHIAALGGDAVVLSFHGALDVDQAQRLRQFDWMSVIADKHAILDLAQLSFVDSTGLRVFFQLQRHVQQSEHELVLCNAQPGVRQLMAVVRLDQLFRLLPSRAAAERWLAYKREGDVIIQGSAVEATLPRRLLWLLYRGAYLVQLGMNRILKSETQGAYVAVWHGDRVLMIRNSYKHVYSLPCGKVKKGETTLLAAQRELFEEVAVQVPLEALHKAWETVSDVEFKHDHIELFEVRLDSLPNYQPDGIEVAWAGFVPVVEAFSLTLFAPVREYLEWTLTQEQRC